MTLRPDESANLSEIERDKLTRRRIQQGAGTAAAIGIGLGYGKIAQKILPYLSEAIPLNVAINGIKKVSPKIANFLERGQKMGLDIQEGMDFVKEELTKPKKQEYQSIFSQLIEGFPVDQLDQRGQKMLGFFKGISDQLESQGKTVKDPAFKKLKKKITDLFKGKTGIIDEEISRDIGQQQTPAGEVIYDTQENIAKSGMGPGQKALMDILQRIQQRRGM